MKQTKEKKTEGRSAQNKDTVEEVKPVSDGEKQTREIGGYEDQGLPEPTRYKDWEVKGRCSDF